MSKVFYDSKSGKVVFPASFEKEITLESLPAILETMFQNGFSCIDAKDAYKSAMEDTSPNQNAQNLATLCKMCAIACENSGKPGGVSTIYNILDARIVRGVRFGRKMAQNLQGSKSLSAFIAINVPMYRSEQTKLCQSVNGTVFAQNKNRYHTSSINEKGKTVKVRSPQRQALKQVADRYVEEDKPNRIRAFFDWMQGKNVPALISESPQAVMVRDSNMA